MPRNVRNFWVELGVSGRMTTVETGPQARDGGIDIIIYQRNKGDIMTAAQITGRARDGHLVLTVRMNGQEYTLESER